MSTPPSRSSFNGHLLGFAIAAVWLFHGIYSKLLDGIPRHRAIVARVLGDDWAGAATLAVGSLEVALGLWVLAAWQRRACALVQTGAVLAMNTLEIALARDLLISAPGMLALNAVFLCLVWRWAAPAEVSGQSPRAAA